jgi:hypothetical protein
MRAPRLSRRCRPTTRMCWFRAITAANLSPASQDFGTVMGERRHDGNKHRKTGVWVRRSLPSEVAPGRQINDRFPVLDSPVLLNLSHGTSSRIFNFGSICSNFESSAASNSQRSF